MQLVKINLYEKVKETKNAVRNSRGKSKLYATNVFISFPPFPQPLLNYLLGGYKNKEEDHTVSGIPKEYFNMN